MTITVNDVKLLKSQRLTDEEDGGGRATGEAIVDNEINNLFPDISRLDRTLGRINLLKVFAGVVTQSQDSYLGAHAIITRKPGDALVSALLFNTNSQTDERLDARAVIEGYVVPSVIADFELIGDQYAGQKTLTCIQHESRPVPRIGDVFQLVTDAHSQFFRITSLEHEMREFFTEDRNGDLVIFIRRMLLIGISAALEEKYPGGQPIPVGTTSKNLDGEEKTKIRATQVADSARYFGINPLAVACTRGDFSITVESIYSQLVPSAIKENPLVDQIGGARKRYSIAASDARRSVSLSFVSVTAGESRTFVGTGVLRGSLELNVSGAIYKDNGAGELKLQSGSAGFSSVLIDYQLGLITAYRSNPYTSGATASYIIGADATGQTVTGEISIKLGNRGFAYTLNLSEAKPRPGTLSVSYMALGRWYDLTDTGSGELVGEGSGSVNFATGSVSLTLEALPDVDTSIIYDYIAQDDFNFTIHTGSESIPRIQIRHDLPDKPIKPSSLTIGHSVNGDIRTATADSGGLISGLGVLGSVNHATGQLILEMTGGLDPETAITFEYEHGDEALQISQTIPATADSGGMSSGTIAGAPLKPGTVSIRWTCKRRSTVPRGSGGALITYYKEHSVDYEAIDDGAGGWRVRVIAGDAVTSNTEVAGAINYTTGEFSLRTESQYIVPAYYADFSSVLRPVMHWSVESASEAIDGNISIKGSGPDPIYEVSTDEIAAPQPELKILTNTLDSIVPGSLLLQWGSEQYVDRDGILYKNIDSKTNAGIAVGSVDYAGRTARLATWPVNSGEVIQRLACLTAASGFSTTYLFFRTPGSPLRSGSMQITAVRTDTAEIITASSDINGVFNTGVIHGSIDAQTGIARIKFTTDPEDTTGASDVKVISSLIRYNAVVQTSLPMSAKLLGLDPVRLPADGRVPIYRDGDVLVIHHTAKTPATTTPDSTITLDRYGQAEIYVMDSNEVRLDPEQYTVDREMGTLTWANPVLIQDEDATPLVPPLTIYDRVEHMTVCTEAQITGAISINSPVPWDLPATETLVSSALTWGDMQARLYRWFTQKTWSTGAPNWTDISQGDQTTAQYDSLNYPPEVANMGSIAGKWAIVFTSTSAFQVVEQKLGVIAIGNTSSDVSPINPATSTPYFTIRAEGWGAGWATGNAIRFNTDACLGPAWVVRTILAGQGAVDDDNFKLQVRGDAN